MDNNFSVAIIGAGLAGCECAFTLARSGIAVTIFEQKPHFCSPAHTNTEISELVCSNSLRSNDLTSGIGLLKQEMRELNSVFMQVADMVAVPAGKALAVDRKNFSAKIAQKLAQEPNIKLIHEQISGINDAILEPYTHIVIAAGPLASDNLSASLSQAIGDEHLYFYDAIAPIVDAESLDYSIIFRGSRYEQENGVDSGDYLNCPMDKPEYEVFYNALMSADKVPTHEFEKEIHFEGCMPIESLAERGIKTLTFGPLKPVGFVDPRTNRRPWAIVQLRAEDANASMFNLVGCQTKLTYAAQEQVFRLIPGMEKVEFIRLGSMHRNTYVNAPKVLTTKLSLHKYPHIYLAGQITGVEGYVESAACGMWVGMILSALCENKELTPPPIDTALGALLGHLSSERKKFQPSNVHFGLMPELTQRAKKAERKILYKERSLQSFAKWMKELNR